MTRGKDTEKDKADRLIDEFQRGRSVTKAAPKLNIPVRTGYHIVEGLKRGSAIEKVEGKGDDDGKKPIPVFRLPQATNRKLDLLVESAARTQEGIAEIKDLVSEGGPAKKIEQRTTEKPQMTSKAAREETSVARPEAREPQTPEFVLGHMERNAISEQVDRVESKMDFAIGLGYANLGATNSVGRDVRVQGWEHQNRPSSPAIEARPFEGCPREAPPDWTQLAAYREPDHISQMNEAVLSTWKTTGEALDKIWDSGNTFVVEYSKSQAKFLERVAAAVLKLDAIPSRPPEPGSEVMEGCPLEHGEVRSTRGGLRWINPPKPTAPSAADSLAQKKTAQDKASEETDRTFRK